MAAQGVGQLQAIRSLSHFIDDTVLIRQYEIVPCALSNQGSPHYAAVRLYRGLFKPANEGLQYLSNMTRHFRIARELSRALADKLVDMHPSLRLNPLDVASYDRVVRNVEPYILVLTHFLESYRYGLADFAPTEEWMNSKKEPYDWVEFSILEGYNNVTRDRICSLYSMLKDILDWELDPAYHNRQLCNVFTFNEVPRSMYWDCLDIFIFGGIEAVKDIMAEPNSTRYPMIVRDHLARACPYGIGKFYAHRLPQSTLPTLDEAADMRVCELLPDYPQTVLNINRRKPNNGPYAPAIPRKWELYRFYYHLISYKGGMPSLL